MNEISLGIAFTDQNLEVEESPAGNYTNKLMTITDQSELKCLAIFQSCATSMTSATDSELNEEVPKAKIGFGALIVTTETVHLTSNFHWLCENISERMLGPDVTFAQPMSNLIELENVTRTTFTLNFMDELESTIEKWRFEFESYPRIARTLDSIDAIWRKIFCVPLINDDQILS